MKTTREMQRAVSQGGLAGSRLLLLSLVVLALPAQRADADVRNAVKRVLPAAVAVQWRNADEDGVGDAQSVLQGTLRGMATATYSVNVDVQTRVVAKTPDVVSLASGTVVSSDGLIVTFIGSTEKGTYEVSFDDGRTLPARLLVDDHRTGLKLLKVDLENTSHVSLAQDDPELGQVVVTVMCTDLKERAVGQGIVSAINRSIPGSLCEMLQTDIVVGAMSAGAPLTDLEGQLRGIIAATSGTPVGQQGRALAIPVSRVRSLLDARKGEETIVVYRGYLGVQIGKGEQPGKLPYAKKAIPETPAAKAGIQDGDEISAINGQAVSDPVDVVRLIGQEKAETEVTVSIRRDGKEQDIKVTLGRHPITPRTDTSFHGSIQTVQPPSFKRLHIITRDGKLEFISPDQIVNVLELPKQPQAPYHTPPMAPTIRVQRSDADKKLDQLSREVQSLRQQIEKLAEQVEAVHQKLPSQPADKKPGSP